MVWHRVLVWHRLIDGVAGIVVVHCTETGGAATLGLWMCI